MDSTYTIQGFGYTGPRKSDCAHVTVTARPAIETHPGLFEDDDIPPQPERQLHARTCPDCGAVYHVAIGACPAVNCPPTLEEAEEAEDVPRRSKKNVDPQDTFIERSHLTQEEHEALLLGLLNSYTGSGITELNFDQTEVFRRTLDRKSVV